MVKTLQRFGQSGASLIKCILMSRRPSKGGHLRSAHERLIILANGPSLRQTIDRYAERLKEETTLSVNFFPNTPEFNALRPDYHVVVDPHFFSGDVKDPNVARLWENICNADWSLTLVLPVRMKKVWRQLKERYSGLKGNSNLAVRWINLTPAEGLDAVSHRLYDLGLAMPRPRNVLIPSIMFAIREGFREIVLTGADHSWSRTLDVDELNRVVSVQPHFYKDNRKELDRVATEYAGYHLHDILNSLTIAFRSYHDIARYAVRRGVRIVNSTPGSMIDAFERAAPFTDVRER